MFDYHNFLKVFGSAALVSSYRLPDESDDCTVPDSKEVVVYTGSG